MVEILQTVSTSRSLFCNENMPVVTELPLNNTLVISYLIYILLTNALDDDASPDTTDVRARYVN